jgi:hypothetical protein
MIVAQLPYNDTRPFVRFTGKFRDLIPQGWTFRKTFNRGYRYYEKKATRGQAIQIWQHCGGYVEIDDFQGDSFAFIAFLLNEENAAKVTWEYEKELAPGWGRGRKSHDFYVNTQKDYLVFAAEYEDRPDAHLHHPSILDISEEEKTALYDAYYREWRYVTVSKELFEATMEMVRSGMVEVVTP